MLEEFSPPASDNVYGGLSYVAKKIENDSKISRLAIVVAPEFVNSDSLKKYINHKKTQGFDVYLMESNGDTETQIRNNLINKYNEDSSKPMAVLIVGDYKKGVETSTGVYIPARYVLNTTNNQYIEDHPTDFYFGEYTDDMNREAFVGRFVVAPEAALQAQTEKTMRMENGVFNGDGNRMTNVLRLSCMWGILSQRLYGYFNEISGKKGLTLHSKILSSDKIYAMNQINSGIGFLVYSGAATSETWKNSITTYDVSTLNNSIYPVIVSATKYTGSYQESENMSLAKSFMNKANGGAVAFIGASAISYESFDISLAVGNYRDTESPDGSSKYFPGIAGSLYNDASKYDFNYKVRTTGGMLQAGHRAIKLPYNGNITEVAKYQIEIYNLLGDPTYMPYIDTPKEITFSYDNAQVGRNFVVYTGAPLAQVALTRKENGDVKIIAAAKATGNGRAVLEIPNDDKNIGTATLYAIAQNYVGKSCDINISRNSGTLGNDATLKNISVAGENIPITTGTYTYNAEVDYEQYPAQIIATPTDNNASILGDGFKYLDVNVSTPITITVTAENGTTQNYMLNVTRKKSNKSNDYRLKLLKVNGQVVEHTASSEWFYDFYIDTNVNSLTIEAEGYDNATLQYDRIVNNLSFGNLGYASVSIEVTSEFGETRSYTLRVYKK